MANFSREIILAVWNKGRIVPGFNPSIMRKDVCGAWIEWNQYGVRNHNRGWEIDHIKALANGGNDLFSNLRPLHWHNNARKSDGNLTCPVTAKVY
jgi:hypothetical protein